MTKLTEGICEALDVACSVIKEKETHRRGKVKNSIQFNFSKRMKFAVTRANYN
jgi:hypothetical protein